MVLQLVQAKKLREGILSNIETFITYTYKCLEMVN